MTPLPVAETTDAWERRYNLALATHPYGLLVIATVLSLVLAGPAPNDRLVTLGLAALAGAWVFVMFTWMDSRWPWQTAGRVVYFVGLLVISGAMVAHSVYAIAFAITCFIQATVLLPTVLTFIGVGLSAVVIYIVPIGFRFPNSQAIVGYCLVIALDMVVIGGGGVLGMRVRREHFRRKELVADLERAMEENAGLQVQLLAQAREAGTQDERGRMAREIHDTLAQGLTGIITQLEAAQQAGDRSPHVDMACALARESLTEARRSVQALRPTPLERSRLPEAVGDMARRWSETSSVPLSFQVTGEPRPLLAELEVALFRVAQEALTNVAKHASASRVGLTLSYMDDVVLLDVRDDGVGFDAAAANGRERGEAGGHRFGLRAMSQRLRQVGGGIEVESAQGAGTAINVRVPAVTAEVGA